MLTEADRELINHLFSAETVLEELETLEESLRESGDLVSWENVLTPRKKLLQEMENLLTTRKKHG